MKLKVERKNRIKKGDKIKCSCCDEVHGVVTKVFEKEIVNWQAQPFTGYEVKNDVDVCGGGIVVCEKSKAVKI